MSNSNMKVWFSVYNSFDTDRRAFVPEVWAQAALMTLESELVAGALVHRDFSNDVAEYGDVVNTRSIGTFTASRIQPGTAITKQSATATKVAIPLDQHVYQSFIIYDREASLAFQDLVAIYLTPAMRAIALHIDTVIQNQVYQFYANPVGKLGTTVTKATIIALQTKMNQNNVPGDNRFCMVSPGVQGQLLNIDEFTHADKFGDDGSAIRNGSIGKLFGTNFVMTNNTPSVTASDVEINGRVNLSAGYAAGSTSIAVDSFATNDPVPGEWITIAGDMTPQKITAYTGSAAGTMTISPGLASAVVNDAVITIYKAGAVNLGAGYAAGIDTALVINGVTLAPRNQQLITFGAAALASDNLYGAMGTPTTTSVTLDRKLGSALSNAAVMGLGPAGDYCLALHPEAIALVTRPLAPPIPGVGVQSAVASYNGYSIRVTFSYDADYQGTVVTVDTLCGVKVLNANLGAILYA